MICYVSDNPRRGVHISKNNAWRRGEEHAKGLRFASAKCIIFQYMHTLEWIIPLIPWPLTNQYKYKGVDSYFGVIRSQKYNKRQMTGEIYGSD